MIAWVDSAFAERFRIPMRGCELRDTLSVPIAGPVPNPYEGL